MTLFRTLVFVLSLLTLAASSPSAVREPRVKAVSGSGRQPFSGRGQLWALRGGAKIGCLTCAQKITVNNALCATFNAVLGEGISSSRPVEITSAEGKCGYSYVPVSPPTTENPKYKIGCGRGADQQWDGPYSVPGQGQNAAFRLLMVGLQRHFMTNDGFLPTGSNTKAIFTDELQNRPQNFQIGWKPV